ncbi:unnamed protein product, partial [Nesidiocoris tenuis]
MLFFRCRPSLHHFRILNSIILAEKMDFVFHACSSLFLNYRCVRQILNRIM